MQVQASVPQQDGRGGGMGLQRGPVALGNSKAARLSRWGAAPRGAQRTRRGGSRLRNRPRGFAPTGGRKYARSRAAHQNVSCAAFAPAALRTCATLTFFDIPHRIPALSSVCLAPYKNDLSALGGGADNHFYFLYFNLKYKKIIALQRLGEPRPHHAPHPRSPEPGWIGERRTEEEIANNTTGTSNL